MTLDEMKQLKQDYTDAFSGEKGKRVFGDMDRWKEKTTIDRDPLRMAFNEGQRSLMLHASNMINMDLDLLAKNLKEAQQQHTELED